MKVLEERNTYLKQIKSENKSVELLDVWDEQLAELGYKISTYRREFIEKIKNKIDFVHKNITGDKEKLVLEYKTSGNDKEEFLNKLKNNRNVDIKNKTTTTGVHRDDISMMINDKNVCTYGSQGQQRSVVISLKIAELEVMEEETHSKPILLLDDFMSELDDERINNFLNNLKNNQVIITCTEKVNINKKSNFLQVANGSLI
jgi:DNA replication and repair protein RecF